MNSIMRNKEVVSMLRISATLAAVAFSASAFAASLDAVPVTVTNESEPVLCAEKDNITIKVTSPEVRRFRIEAAHPPYIGGLVKDNWEADWTACDMTGDPSFTAPVPPRRVTFYESIEYWLVGYTFPTFWRPADTTFKVGDRVEKGLHLVQLWKLGKDKSYEVLVVYPQDGYWRARPMPPAHLNFSAYGSSFLFGPVEQEGRPVVNIKQIEFDPKTLEFRMAFKDGSNGSLKLESVDENRMILDAVLDRPVGGGKAFAALRSMYVTDFNNDVSRIAVREPGARRWREEHILDFQKAQGTDVWMGRLTHSQHNTSSPDHVFKGFSKDPKRPEPAAPRKP
jgi:hypothetical protein